MAKFELVGFAGSANVSSHGLRVNLTLCFSQQQAAAVYAATNGTREPAYVSPFVGRLDDIAQNGTGLIENTKQMLAHGDGHLLVLAARGSISWW